MGHFKITLNIEIEDEYNTMDEAKEAMINFIQNSEINDKGYSWENLIEVEYISEEFK